MRLYGCMSIYTYINAWQEGTMGAWGVVGQGAGCTTMFIGPMGGLRLWLWWGRQARADAAGAAGARIHMGRPCNALMACCRPPGG